VSGDDASQLKFSAQDFVHTFLDKHGLDYNREVPGTGVGEVAGELVGGVGAAKLAEGAMGLTKYAPKVITDPNAIGVLAGPNGLANNKIISAIGAQALGADPATKLDAAGLGEVKQGIGKLLDIGRNAGNITLGAPENILNDLSDIAKNRGFDSTNIDILAKNPAVKNVIARVQTGALNGEQMGQLSSELGKEAESVIKNNYSAGKALLDMKDYLEQQISTSLPQGLREAYNIGRQRYKTLMDLVPHVNPGTGEVDATGLVRQYSKYETQPFKMPTQQQLATESPLMTAARNVSKSLSPAESGADMAGDVLSHSPSSSGVRALLRTVPGAFQYIRQFGASNTARVVMSNPQYAAVFSSELARQNHQEDLHKDD
jgi:hypothetical protein